jgi:hypothetical protein
MPRVSDTKYLVMAGWNDVPHLDEKTKKELYDATPAHLRDARSKGLPALGSGAVFPVKEEDLTCEPFAIPAHWPRICGMDFGWDHPNANAWIAWDRDSDTLYVYDCYRVRQTLIPTIASSIRARGDWIPVAWPHDGYQVKDAMSGHQVAEQYRHEKVNMLHEHAQFLPTTDGDPLTSIVSVEAGIQEMLTRMATGRFKVFKHLNEWFEEYRLYHRKEGVIVKLADDLLSATRYGMMMLRYAIVEPKKSDSSSRRPYNWRAG